MCWVRKRKDKTEFETILKCTYIKVAKDLILVINRNRVFDLAVNYKKFLKFFNKVYVIELFSDFLLLLFSITVNTINCLKAKFSSSVKIERV